MGFLMYYGRARAYLLRWGNNNGFVVQTQEIVEEITPHAPVIKNTRQVYLLIPFLWAFLVRDKDLIFDFSISFYHCCNGFVLKTRKMESSNACTAVFSSRM